MWNYKEEDLVKEGNDKDKIITSGVYSFKIKEARMVNSISSAAKAVQLFFEDEYGYVSAKLWHIKGNGEPNEYAEAKLNQLLFLCKLKIDQIKTEKKELQGKDGAYAVYSIKAFEGKEVAVALEITKKGDYDQIEIKEFFEFKSKKTTKELKEKAEATKWKYYTEKYKNVPKAKEETKSENNEAQEVDDDDFPF